MKQIIMIYHAADDAQLKTSMYKNYEDICKNFSSLDENSEIYILADHNFDLGPDEKYQDRLVKITSSGVEELLKGTDLYARMNGKNNKNIDLNLNSSETLENFISYVKEANSGVEAEYSLLFNGHGGGIGGTGTDLHPDTEKPVEIKTISLLDLKNVIAGKNITNLLFDACLMSNLEASIIFQKTGAKWLVGSEENVGGNGLDYTEFLRNLAKVSSENSTVAKAFYQSALTTDSFENITMLNLSKAGDLLSASKEFAAAANKLSSKLFKKIADAVMETLYLSAGSGNSAPEESEYSGSDLGIFLNRVMYYFPVGELFNKAKALSDAFKAAITDSNGKGKFIEAFGVNVFLNLNITEGFDEPYSLERMQLGEEWRRFTDKLTHVPIKDLFGHSWKFAPDFTYEKHDFKMSETSQNATFSVVNISDNAYFDQLAFAVTPLALKRLYAFSVKKAGESISISADKAPDEAQMYIYEEIDGILHQVHSGKISSQANTYIFNKADTVYYIGIDTKQDFTCSIVTKAAPILNLENPSENRAVVYVQSLKTEDAGYTICNSFNNTKSFFAFSDDETIEIYSVAKNSVVEFATQDEKGKVLHQFSSPELPEYEGSSTTIRTVSNNITDLIFAIPTGIWGNSYVAKHVGALENEWSGSGEFAVILGKNRFQSDFYGGNDETNLVLTNSKNGDALFFDDSCTGSSNSRFEKISNIYCGEGDDFVDLTSAKYSYIQHFDGLKVDGEEGNDVIWGGNGKNILSGDEGDDVLYGGVKDDILYGGDGDDLLRGFGGNDTFLYDGSESWGNDKIIADATGTINLKFKSVNLEELKFNNGDKETSNVLTWQDEDCGGSITLIGKTFGDASINLSNFSDISEIINSKLC